MPILNYTTQIAADKTVSEIQRILGQHGAKQILTEYENGEVSSISFQIITSAGPRAFTLPANVEGVLSVMTKQHRARQINLPASRLNRDQARRVAWRILKDWIEAQMALVESNQVTLDQVMLPYLQVEKGVSLYQLMQTHNLALPAPKG